MKGPPFRLQNDRKTPFSSVSSTKISQIAITQLFLLAARFDSTAHGPKKEDIHWPGPSRDLGMRGNAVYPWTIAEFSE